MPFTMAVPMSQALVDRYVERRETLERRRVAIGAILVIVGVALNITVRSVLILRFGAACHCCEGWYFDRNASKSFFYLGWWLLAALHLSTVLWASGFLIGVVAGTPLVFRRLPGAEDIIYPLDPSKCPKCSYALSGLDGDHCPECGFGRDD